MPACLQQTLVTETAEQAAAACAQHAQHGRNLLKQHREQLGNKQAAMSAQLQHARLSMKQMKGCLTCLVHHAHQAVAA